MRKVVLLFAVLMGVFAGCSNDKEPDLISLNETSKTLSYKDEYQIEAKSNSKITYLSENKYHAEVSESGFVKANRIGETNILVSNSEDSKSVKITVKPKYNTYTEPDVKFGDTKSSIITKFGNDYVETSNGIAYANYSNAAPIVMFLFDDDNKLDDYAVMVKTVYSSDLVDFLLERYLAIAESDGIFMFINGLNINTATTAIGLSLYDISYWMVMYIPNTPNVRSASLRSNVFSDKYTQLLEQIQ